MMGGLGTYGFNAGEWIAGTPYRIVRPLGRGGMGEVYEDDHTRTGTRRAIKVLGCRVSPTSAIALRLRVEGEALLRLEHRNVVRVYEVGALGDGRPFFSMELLDGETMRHLLARPQNLSLPAAVDLVLQALEGLDAAHRRGMTHRDVKPGNLFVQRDGTVKLLDFGIVKFHDRRVRTLQTETGLVLGTRRYMAPEQIGGGPAGPWTDVFAAGVVLFELLTGVHPSDAHEASTGSSLRWFDAPLPSLRLWAPHAPSGLDAVLATAMQADPSRRFADARAFSNAILEHVPPVSAVPHPLAHRVLPDKAASLTFSAHDSSTRQSCRDRRSRHVLGASLLSRMHALGLVLSLGAVVLAGLAAWSARTALRQSRAASQALCVPPEASIGRPPHSKLPVVVGDAASAR